MPNAPRSPVVLPNEAAAAKATANESYVAEVLGNDVFIRSGPGTQFYQCGKLYAGDRVQVVKIAAEAGRASSRLRAASRGLRCST